MKKVFILSILCAAVLAAGFGKEKAVKVTASTSWTAAFADIAGADQVDIIAPANLRHPPEYEITVSDLLKVQQSDFFIYAGFERMMKTIGDAAGGSDAAASGAASSGASAGKAAAGKRGSKSGKATKSTKAPVMVKITCENSVATVEAEAGKIAALLGTEEAYKVRITEYKAAIEKGRQKVSEMGLKGAKVLCNKNQIYLAKELGFEVAAIFGPGAVTSGQIADAKNGGYALIIDNVHNPVGGPLTEAAPSSKYIIWRNFPEAAGRGSLVKVIEENINQL